MIERIGAKLGVEGMLTPECHAKIAGDGVECMWACSKGAFHILALKESKWICYGLVNSGKVMLLNIMNN